VITSPTSCRKLGSTRLQNR